MLCCYFWVLLIQQEKGGRAPVHESKINSMCAANRASLEVRTLGLLLLLLVLLLVMLLLLLVLLLLVEMHRRLSNTRWYSVDVSSPCNPRRRDMSCGTIVNSSGSNLLVVEQVG